MKKIFILAAAAFAAISVSARDYSPTTTWPYANPDFESGQITLFSGAVKAAIVNVCLAKSTLHYLDGEFVKETFDVRQVTVGGDIFVNVAGKLMRVLAHSDKGYVVEGVEIDFGRLNSTGAAYGSSSTTLGTMNLSSLEGIGATNSNSSLTHMELKAGKEGGAILPLNRKKYLYVGGKAVYATKKDVGEAVGKDRLKAYLKDHKVKWNDASSLIALVELFGE